MDSSKDDPSNNGEDKRKSESDYPTSTKKFCSDPILKTDSFDLSSQVSTSNIQEISTFSSDLEVASEKTFENEELALPTCLQVEDQSHNIGSTTESLDDLQSDVSLNNINISPFISTSCETSQTPLNTCVESSTNISNIEDSLKVSKHLNTEGNEIQISQAEHTIPTSSLSLMEPKQCYEITESTSDINNENFSSLEAPLVTSSDQVCSTEQSNDNKIAQETLLTCTDKLTSDSQIASDKVKITEDYIGSTSSKSKINNESSFTTNISSLPVKDVNEQVYSSEETPKSLNEELMQLSSEISYDDSATNNKNQCENKSNQESGDKKSQEDFQVVSTMSDKVADILPELQETHKNIQREDTTKSENEAPLCNESKLSSFPENFDETVPLDKNLISSVSCSETTGVTCSSEENLSSTLPTQDNLAKSANEMLVASLPNDENLDATQPNEDNLSTIPSLEEKLLSFPAKENLPTTLSVEEQLTTSQIFEKNLPTNSIVEENLDQSIMLKEPTTASTVGENSMNDAFIKENEEPSVTSLEDDLSSTLTNFSNIPLHVSGTHELKDISISSKETETADHSLKSGPETQNSLADNKSLTFKESLKNISMGENVEKQSKNSLSEEEWKNQVPKIDSSFVPISRPMQEITFMVPDIESEIDKKSEVSAMEVDSTNTPAEGSSVDTPCDSGETSPCISTPIDSCQVSAAPSPILKEDPNMASESLLYDESSMDTKDLTEECLDGKEQEGEIKPAKPIKKKSKKSVAESKKTKGKTSKYIFFL